MRPKHSVTGAAAENEIATGRKNAAPVVRIEFTGPDFFAGVHVPGLNFADMIGSFRHRHLSASAHVRASGHVGHFSALDHAAVVIVGRYVKQSTFRIVGGWRPVFATPQRGTKRSGVTGGWFVFRIVGRTPSFRVEASEGVLINIGFSVNEADIVGRSFEGPQVAVAARMHQRVNHPALALDWHQDRRRNLVPIP